LANDVWFNEVLTQVAKAWQRREAEVPTELAAAERGLADVETKISRLVDRIEEVDGDPDIQRRLEDRRGERRELKKRVEQLKAANDLRRPAPTEEWLREQLSQLHTCLAEPTPAATYALRNLIGGSIVVTEIRLEGRKRHYLRGQFTMRCNAVVNAVSGGGSSSQDGTAGNDGALSELIVIDFKDPNPLDADAELAKSLQDQGLLNTAIAKRLGWSRSKVTKALKHWYTSHGLTMPDGRSRRKNLTQKTLEPPFYQRIADEVYRLCEEGMAIGKMADHFHCDINTITAAIRFAYESRGLPVPDGRTRRKTLRENSQRVASANLLSSSDEAGSTHNSSGLAGGDSGMISATSPS